MPVSEAGDSAWQGVALTHASCPCCFLLHTHPKARPWSRWAFGHMSLLPGLGPIPSLLSATEAAPVLLFQFLVSLLEAWIHPP